MRARWHQLLKLNCVSEENSRDSVRAEVPTARATASISCEAVGSASTMSAARRQRGSWGSGMKNPARVISFVNGAHFIDHYSMLVFAAAVIVMGPALGMAYSELL